MLHQLLPPFYSQYFGCPPNIFNMSTPVLATSRSMVSRCCIKLKLSYSFEPLIPLGIKTCNMYVYWCPVPKTSARSANKLRLGVIYWGWIEYLPFEYNFEISHRWISILVYSWIHYIIGLWQKRWLRLYYVRRYINLLDIIAYWLEHLLYKTKSTDSILREGVAVWEPPYTLTLQ